MSEHTEGELLDLVASWHEGCHEGGSTQPLHEYLGWTHDEYKHWVETSEQPGSDDAQ